MCAYIFIYLNTCICIYATVQTQPSVLFFTDEITVERVIDHPITHLPQLQGSHYTPPSSRTFLQWDTTPSS